MKSERLYRYSYGSHELPNVKSLSRIHKTVCFRQMDYQAATKYKMSETSALVDQSAARDLAFDGAGQGDSSSLTPSGGGGDIGGVVKQLSIDNGVVDADVSIEEVEQVVGMQAGDDGGATSQGGERRSSQNMDDDDSEASVSKNVSSEPADRKVRCVCVCLCELA